MTTHATALTAKLFHPNVIRVVSIALAIVFGILYISQMNQASMKGYAIRDLETDRRELVREQDRLLAEVDRLRSLGSIRERQAFLGLVRVQNVKYVKAASSEVALR